jgi:carbohydrate-selective porin OprB
MATTGKRKKTSEITKHSIFSYFAFCCLTSFTFAAPSSSDVTISAASNAINANPAATNIETGTGNLQKYIEKRLGIRDDHGIRMGGALVADTNNLFSGGTPRADRWPQNYLFIFNITAEDLINIAFSVARN